MNNYSGVRYSQMQLRSNMLIKYVWLFMETMNLTLRSKKNHRMGFKSQTPNPPLCIVISDIMCNIILFLVMTYCALYF